ncbi:MAG: hypothetical protein GY810_09680 [Aureispira sp.]|nr:hypothetical protein [Aureispira sp.]
MRKLIHIFLMTLSILFLADFSTAQVVYVDVNPDETVTGASPKQYDLNGDGKEDILFFIKTGFGQFCTPVRPTFNSGTLAVESEIISAVNPVIDKLAFNASINSIENFAAGNTGFCAACIRANFPWTGGATDVYIGFRFRLTGESSPDWHYGWALLDVSSTIASVVVKEFGWETTLNTPILAGDKGVVPVTSISVQGQGGATTISTNGGTLQMEETVLPANATNKNVTWSITGGTGSGTISPTGLLTAVSNGTVIVRATAQDGSGIFGETTITLSNQIVSVTSITVQGQGGATTISTPGGTLQMEETVLPANATNKNVTWSVDNASIGSISPTGLLTAVSNGSVTVFATAQDGSGVSGSTVITISNQPILVTGITVQGQGGATTITTNGGTLQMEETVTPVNATNQAVTWSITGGTGGGTISPTGLLTAVTNGTVIVRATAQDGSGVFGETTITISNQIVLVTGITVQGQGGATTITTNSGTLQMEETVTPVNATNQNVSWSITGGTGSGTISPTGLLTAVTNGTVIVRATAQDGSGVFGETTITISNQIVLVTGITVQGQGGATTITTNGGTLQMEETVTPVNATNQAVTWSITGGTGSGTISPTGLLTAVTNGTVIVRATAQDGSGVFGETTITISNQIVLVTGITVQGQGGATTITTNGGTLQMVETVTPVNATNQSVSWSITGGTGSGTISPTGLLTAVTNGTVIVRATAQDGSGIFGETTITISNQIVLVTGITVQGQGGATTITTNGGTLQMEETVTPVNATNQAVSWSITGGTGSGTISPTGLLTAVTNGTVIVRATAQDGSGVFGETTITISNQIVLVTGITVQGQGGATTITTNGGTLQMVETVTPVNATNQAVTWSITGGTGSGTISPTGLLTAVTNGTVIVRATAQDGSGIFGETTITISNQIVLVTGITVQGQGGATTITTNGGTLQMMETVTPVNATNQAVTWSITGGTGSGTISPTGLLTAVTNGTVIVRATAQDGSGVFGETTITISNQIVLVTGITVQGQGGATTITTNGGTLQMVETVTPVNATNQAVTWSITGGTGSGTISPTGLLTAVTNGTVIVRATA